MVDIWWNLIKIVTISIDVLTQKHVYQMKHENVMKKKNVNKLIKHFLKNSHIHTHSVRRKEING